MRLRQAPDRLIGASQHLGRPIFVMGVKYFVRFSAVGRSEQLVVQSQYVRVFVRPPNSAIAIQFCGSSKYTNTSVKSKSAG